MWGSLKNHLYCLYDAWRGVDFHEGVSSDIDGSNISSHMKYTPSSFRRMKAIASFLRPKIKKDDMIIDLGCGKGKCLEIFSSLPFSQVDGLEYSQELANIARKNMKTLGLKSCIYQDDALTFNQYDKYNYVYMYNPFQGKIFEAMLNNLKSSLIKRPREMTIIYVVPACHDLLIKAGFVLEKKLDSNIYIYSNTPQIISNN